MQKEKVLASLPRLHAERSLLLHQRERVSELFSSHAVSPQLVHSVLQKCRAFKEAAREEAAVDKLRDLDFLVVSFQRDARLSLHDLLSYLTTFASYSSLQAKQQVEATLAS